ncbi:MAG: TetR/AcrR family transcriptional regulator [Proteobacteria bacterium]|nr:TetR/AcrR family transcriptional regulator [Pseudomonadota bacterium]
MAESDLREVIVREATRLFAQRGYGSTSMRELAAAAGVTKPTLYYHFGNKESLFLDVVHFHISQIDDLVRDALAVDGGVRDRLRRFAVSYIQEGAANQDALRLLVTVQHPVDKGQPMVDVMSLHLRKIDVLRVVFQKGLDQDELRADLDLGAAVMAFIGMVNLACMAAVFSPCAGPFDVEGQADQILDIFFRGVGA